MSKIRINDLARELEVKSKSILDVLPEIGVTEKKSHSSSLEDHEADKVRARLRSNSTAQVSSRSSRPGRVETDEIKTKIDLSQISKPGDALKAIISKQQGPTVATPPPPAAPAIETKAAVTPAPSVSAPPRPTSPPPPAPRLVVPTSTPRPTFTVPAPPPPQASAPAAPAAPVSAKPPAAAPVSPAAHVATTTPAITPARPTAPQVQPPTTVARPAAPVAPPPRMIVPQTGPRPVYKAP